MALVAGVLAALGRILSLLWDASGFVSTLPLIAGLILGGYAAYQVGVALGY